MTVSPTTAAVIVIGDEVLSARVKDVNSVYLCRRLTDLGVAVRRVVVVPDDVPVISAEIATCAASYTHVVTSGGVGPTHDDVTMVAVAGAFDVALQRNPDAEAVIRRFYGPHMADAALSMADLPTGAELIMRAGMRFPVVRVQNVWVFPGSPDLLEKKFEAVSDVFATTPFITTRLALTVAEPEIVNELTRIHEAHPQVDIGSYPQGRNAPFQTLITVTAKDADAVAVAMAALRVAFAAHVTDTPPTPAR